MQRLLKDFKTIKRGKEYIAMYKKSKRELQKYVNATILLISNDNLKMLIERKDIKEYEYFYDENY